MNRRITVIGGGLVGSLCALFLEKKGHPVSLFEKRDNPLGKGSGAVGEGRSINLAISVRGLHALSLLGYKEEVMENVIPMRGRMLHDREGGLQFQAYGDPELDAIYSLSRGWLNRFLLEKASQKSDITSYFRHELSEIDFLKRSISFKGGATATYDTIIGSDGSASVIRHAMEMAGFASVSSVELSHSYKEFIMPAVSGANSASGLAGGENPFAMEPHALHIWPRGEFMLIALPNLDGSYTCTLFLRSTGPLSFESLQTPQSVCELFEREFADFVKLTPDYCEQFFSHPTGRMYTVKTSAWSPIPHAKEVLLIGDAAHAIVPFFGQGMNCGFEDCAELFTGWEASLESGFTDFWRSRKPNTDAVADMAVENFVEMSAKVADPKFLLQKAVEKELQTRFPQYRSRYSLVSFSRVPYSLASRVGRVQDQILGELCRGVTAPEQVSFENAQKLIQQHLSPVLRDISVWEQSWN